MKAASVMIVCGLFACSPPPQGKKGAASQPVVQPRPSASGKRAKVTMYVMSKCPYGVQAVEGMRDALAMLGGGATLQLDYIAQEKGGKWRSLHGEPEIVGDIHQLCAQELAPGKWLDFLGCVNASWESIPQNGEGCAQKVGLDKGRFKACVDGPRGKALLRASALRAEAAGAVGSPTIVVGGRAYDGGRDALDLARAICTRAGDHEPAACAKLPQPVAVEAIVLHDSRCKRRSCTELGPQLAEMLRVRFFPGLKVRAVEYSSSEGKKLYAELGIKHLPAWIVDKGVTKTHKYDQVSRFMAPAGDRLVLRLPADFDPTAEICDNGIDDTQNGKIDCKDPGCAGFLGCRQEKKRHLSVFVMSQCPFGVRAINAMKEVLGNFGDKLAFDVHYIAELDPKQKSGFDALHGDAEAYENMRQLCAKKHYAKGNKYLQYIWCRNADVTSDDWKKCAKAGIKARVIERCMKSGDGAKLLARDIVIAQQLKISASPTWLANNRHKFLGITPETIKRQLCSQNKGLAGCEKKLRDKADVPAGGACGK